VLDANSEPENHIELIPSEGDMTLEYLIFLNLRGQRWPEQSGDRSPFGLTCNSVPINWYDASRHA
jgi:hypothetical protein